MGRAVENAHEGTSGKKICHVAIFMAEVYAKFIFSGSISLQLPSKWCFIFSPLSMDRQIRKGHFLLLSLG